MVMMMMNKKNLKLNDRNYFAQQKGLIFIFTSTLGKTEMRRDLGTIGLFNVNPQTGAQTVYGRSKNISVTGRTNHVGSAYNEIRGEADSKNHQLGHLSFLFYFIFFNTSV